MQNQVEAKLRLMWTINLTVQTSTKYFHLDFSSAALDIFGIDDTLVRFTQTSSPAGEEHCCEPHLQDWQGPARAGLLPEALQPPGLRWAIPEVQTAPLQIGSVQHVLDLPAAPAPPRRDAAGPQPADADAVLHGHFKLRTFNGQQGP